MEIICQRDQYAIRLVPSLTTLKLIHDSPMDYHCGKDALIVGDIDVGVVLLNEKKNIYK